MNDFGELLGRYRQRLGLNQRELASAIDLDSTQVNKIERGKRPPPGGRRVLAMVKALRLQPTEARAFVQAAGLDPVILEEETGARAAIGTRSQQPPRKETRSGVPEQHVASPAAIDPQVLAAAGVAGSPLQLGPDLLQRVGPTIDETVSQILAEYDLPFHERSLARRLIKAAVRAICAGLKQDLDGVDDA